MSDIQDKVKNSVNLPKTAFPMKANLPTKEAYITRFWDNIDIYDKLMEKRKGRAKGYEQFVLHLGPPYANGKLHIGHAFNQSLKDLVLRAQSMFGKYTPVLPTWDCHGLPIEYKVEEKVRKDGGNKNNLSKLEFRSMCRDFAQYWVDEQCGQARRLGFLGDWDNPYLTMDKEFEHSILSELYKFVNNGSLYRDLRPVLWSVVEETALAEYETEYFDIVSDAIYVGFEIASSFIKELEGTKVIIWTTTPWTIPANRALAFGADIEYVVVKRVSVDEEEQERFVVAKELVADVMKNMEIDSYEEIFVFKGSDLGKTIAHHPLSFHPDAHGAYDFSIPCVLGHHVNTTSGTGIVHTAPSHGPDDFVIGKKYELDVPCLVDGKGIYTKEVGLFAGVHIFKAGALVIEALGKAHNLYFQEKYEHNYPHSWRSKAPLIYLTTDQWFIEIDNSGIRNRAISEAKKVKWWPCQGKARMLTMLRNRPDWCLSRQRIWGVPIAIFVNKKTKEILRDIKIQERIAKAFLDCGSDVWFEGDPTRFLESDYNHDDFEAIFDIVDVWFESGTTHAAVLENNPRYSSLKTPADMYLEGTDQHRGWFQSSLIESCGTNGFSPYKQVMTHGFVLDDKGYKMSKSAKNGLSPEEIVQDYGAEIIRIWTAFSDYYLDVRIGKENLKQCQDIYRKLRNTLRYLLGVVKIDEVKIQGDIINIEGYQPLERWVLASVYQLDKKVKAHLECFDFKSAYVDIHSFCVNSLSAFYFDIRKDVLYCEGKDSKLRIQTIKVMSEVFHWLVRILVPLLPFTCEEAWFEYKGLNMEDIDGSKHSDVELKKNYEKYADYESIHYQEFHLLRENLSNSEIIDSMEQFVIYKNAIAVALEECRKKGSINSNLEAKVIFEKDIAWPFMKDEVLSYLLIAEFEIGDIATCDIVVEDNDLDIKIGVCQSNFAKCERCWRRTEDCQLLEDINLCARCIEIIV